MHHIELLPQFSPLQQLFDEIYAVRGPRSECNSTVAEILDMPSPVPDCTSISYALDAEIDQATGLRWKAWWQAYKEPIPLVPSGDLGSITLATVWSRSDLTWLLTRCARDPLIAQSVLPPRVQWDLLITSTEKNLNAVWACHGIFAQIQNRLLNLAPQTGLAQEMLPRLDEGFIRPYVLLLLVGSFVVCMKWTTRNA